MKRVLLLMVAITLGFSIVVNAKMLPTVAIKVPNNLKEIINNEFDYPVGAAINFIESDVWIKITLIDESTLKIIDLSTTDPELGIYVKKELSSLYMYNPGTKRGQVYFLKVKFDLVNKLS